MTQTLDPNPSSATTHDQVDPARLEAAVGQVFSALAVGIGLPLVVLGDQLGLWKTMAGAGPLTSTGLAERTGLVERYVREWLRAVCVAGYVEYDDTREAFTLTPEMGLVLADDDTPTSLIGIFAGFAAFWADLDSVAAFFRNGSGMAWQHHHPSLSAAQARFTRPIFRSQLGDWVAGVPGLTDRLRAGARVLDLGCGEGVSTQVLSQAFPASTFTGIDVDDVAVSRARAAAAHAGLTARVDFEVGSATSFGADGAYDLVLFSDCLHDLGDPVAAVANSRRVLAEDGVVLVIEPLAADRFADDLHNPYAPIGYAVSTMVCVPSSLAMPAGAALGAMAGEARLRDVLGQGGLGTVRRMPTGPMSLNIVLEARP